jgi:outer membrane protein OmpA-like peptidoglycan-associated protein
MAEDWAVNVKKYDANADDGVIAGIVRYCGIALQKRDSSLVSFGDPVETGRVRENYLKKKLGLTHSDADLDAAIADVGVQMKDESFRNRVTVYYLLAQKFNLLHMFGKGGAAAEPETVIAAAEPAVEAVAAPVAAAAAAPVAAAATAAAAVGAVGATATAAAAQPLASSYGNDEEPKSGMGWLPWLLGGLVLLGALWWFLSRPSAEAPAPVATEAAAPAVTEAAPAATEAAAPAAEAPVAIPTGAGVTSDTRDGKPAVKVYFDTNKTDVVPAFAPAAAAVKAYLDTHAGSKLAVTGFADKRGNAARNAALSKGRAEAVKAELVKAGIAEGSIELVKPADSVDPQDDLAGARRVEVTIQ